MNDSAIYNATVPVFLRMLNNLDKWLDMAEAHGAAKGFTMDSLLQARLAPDMFTLLGQVQMATAFAKNIACRLAGQTPPDFPNAETNSVELRARIERARAIVKSISADALVDAATREITVQTGPDTRMTLSGNDYLHIYGMPQFYFHVTMTYAILRHNGVGLGKRDFIGGLS